MSNKTLADLITIKLGDSHGKRTKDINDNFALIQEIVPTRDEITTTLSDYIKNDQKGVANGVATLGANGKVPSSQLPSYVDDAIEIQYIGDGSVNGTEVGDFYYNETTHKLYVWDGSDWNEADPATPEKGKIYVDISTEKIYRWSGSILVEISPSTGGDGTASVETRTFLSTDANWSNLLADGTYALTLTITPGQKPIKVYKTEESNNVEVVVDIAINAAGNSMIIKSNTVFSGSVDLIG